MRTIKFRVWDKAINKMITQENVRKFLDETISVKWEDKFPYFSDEWYPAYEILTIFDYLKDFQEITIKRYEPSENRFDIMQYTGLHDKNGKEIYEGDIIKSYFENGLGAENKCLIIYDEYLCAFMGQELRTKQQYLFNEGNPNKKDKQLKYTEVIGNIYDNKNLLVEGE